MKVKVSVAGASYENVLDTLICIFKMFLVSQWMKEMWRSDSCYGNYGVDGSTCSFFIYLSEVSTVCVLPVGECTKPQGKCKI